MIVDTIRSYGCSFSTFSGFGLFFVIHVCRRLHTELVKCGSDVEYLAKVYCLRQAYTKLFKLPAATMFIADMGRQVLSDLIMYIERVREHRISQ